MRNQWQTVLAGIAALALIAGTGFASAQEHPNKQPGAVQAKGSQASRSMNKAPGGQAAGKAQLSGKMGSAAQNAGTAASKSKSIQRMGQSTGPKAKAPSATRHAQMTNRASAKNASKGAPHFAQQRKGQTMAQSTRARPGTAATAQRVQGRTTLAHRGATLKGLQGNAAMQAGAAGNNVRLTAQQRTTIRRTVLNAPGAPIAKSVPFGVRVGTVIPGGFNMAPLPSTLVEIDPAWSGYEYFVFRHEIVIVNPANMTIVAVLPV